MTQCNNPQQEHPEHESGDAWALLVSVAIALTLVSIFSTPIFDFCWWLAGLLSPEVLAP